MEAKSSIHLAPGASGYLAHNSRESYSKSQVFHDEKNEIWNLKNEAFKIYKSELAARSDAYTKKTNQRLQKNTITHLSAIINLHKHHTLTDLKELMNYLEKTLDTKIFQMAIHRDEGKLINKENGLKLVSGEDFFCNPKDKKLYFDEKFEKPINMSEWIVEKNYHVHLEMMGIDSQGKAIKRERLTRTFLKELQTFTAKSLNMERGKEVDPYTKAEMLEIKSHLKEKSEYTSSRAFGIAFNKVAKELGYYKKNTKRLDTHEHKQRAKAINDVVKEKLEEKQKLIDKANKIIRDKKATIANVKAEGMALRAELSTLDKKLLRREDWAKYDAEIKKLKVEAKAKELTVPALDSRIAELRNRYLAPVLEINQNRKAENDRLRNRANANDRADAERTAERARSYERATVECSNATKALSNATSGDFGRATQTYQAKRTATANLDFAERVANGFSQFYRKIQEIVSELAPISREDALRFVIGVEGGKKMPIFERIKELKGKIKTLETKEIPKSIPTLEDAISIISKHADITKNKVVSMVQHGIDFGKPSVEWKETREQYKKAYNQSQKQNKGIERG